MQQLSMLYTYYSRGLKLSVQKICNIWTLSCFSDYLDVGMIGGCRIGSSVDLIGPSILLLRVCIQSLHFGMLWTHSADFLPFRFLVGVPLQFSGCDCTFHPFCPRFESPAHHLCIVFHNLFDAIICHRIVKKWLKVT